MAGFQFATMQDVQRIAKSVLRSERALRGGESFGYAGSKNQIWFPFKNEYAGEIPAYSVVEITSATLVSEIGMLYYKVTRPSTTFRGPGGYGVTSGLAVPTGGTGQLRFSGTCRVAYDSGTPALYEGWGVKPSQFTLSKGYPSLCTVSGVENSTRKWLLGTLAPIGTLLCKATATNVSGAMATDTSDYKIYSGTAGSEADAGFTTQPAIYSRVTTVINEFFRAKWLNNSWYAEVDDNSWLGKADAAIASAASGTISLWTGTEGSETDSTDNVTAYNRTSVAIPLSGWVHVMRANGKLYCEPWSC